MFVTLNRSGDVTMYYAEQYVPEGVAFFEVGCLPAKPDTENEYRLMANVEEERLWWERMISEPEHPEPETTDAEMAAAILEGVNAV